jgi:phosphohistidine phosphatase
MKNLILIRHGKSSWEAPFKDIDRSLNQKGIYEAHLVASNCLRFLPPSYVVWGSVAKRASQTALIFAQNILYPIESIVFKQELYTFDENKLEKAIKSGNNISENIILFGHNEAITNFVNKFGDIFIDHVPTAGFVALQFDTEDWKKINKGKTKKILFPKNLK